MAGEKVIGKRQRADSVLGNRMDEHLGYKRMKVQGDKWRKIKHIIDKDTTQLFLFEVPKGVSNQNLECLQFSIEKEIVNLNLVEKVKAAEKNQARKFSKMVSASSKNCVLTVDASDEPHLNQLLLLTPQHRTGGNPENESDDGGKNSAKEGNLEISKKLSGFFKVCELISTPEIKPKMEHTISEVFKKR